MPSIAGYRTVSKQGPRAQEGRIRTCVTVSMLRVGAAAMLRVGAAAERMLIVVPV